MTDPARAPRTVADLVAAAAARTPRRLAIVDGPRRASWEELDAAAGALAAGLLAGGLLPGDRLLVQLPTGLPMVELYLGAVRAGIVVVPVNPAYTVAELEFILDDSGARGLVTGAAETVAAADRFGDLPVLATTVAHRADPGRFRPFAELTRPGVPVPDQLRDQLVDPESVAVLFYTSGTSGRPKGAMLSHRALLANIAQGLAITPPPTTAHDVILLPIPLFHIFGLNAGLGIALAQGSTAVLVDHFDAHETLRLVVEESVTVLVGAPAMFGAWMHVPDFAERLAGLRFALSGSAPLQAALAAHYREAGVALHDGYGLTEAAPVVTSNVVDRSGRSRIGQPKVGSVGAPLPGIEIELRDATGAPVEDDDPGLIAVRGANLFSGYWPDGRGGPGTDGWWMTGDLGYVDDDGDLVLVGRESDLVIVNGFNVYPAEVEAILAAQPGVAEVAVLGVPDPSSGEALVAYVVARTGEQVDPDALLAAAGRSLAKFKLPRRVELVDAMPHTVTGKVKKWQLRAERGAL